MQPYSPLVGAPRRAESFERKRERERDRRRRPYLLPLKSICDPLSVREFLCLIYQLFLVYLLPIIYLLFLIHLLFLIQLLCLIYLLFRIYVRACESVRACVCVRRREKPSHGQTLPLRYTAHIVAELVFDDFLAAPAGGFS